jgi:hypothetical protein
MRDDSIGFFWDDTPPPKPPKKEKEKRQPPNPVWLSPDYLPGLAEALAFPVQEMTLEELSIARHQRQELLHDVECFPNYFLAMFKNTVTGKVAYVEAYEGHPLDTRKLKWLMESFTLVTFNGIHYDLPMCEMAVGGMSLSELKDTSDKIIQQELRGSDLRRAAKIKALKVDHIDLIEVAPLFASLKTYAGRLHAPKMQDLPFHPSTWLSPEQRAIVKWYCVNDTDNTGLLRKCLNEQIELRYNLSNEYTVDLRSKSDAQIAEAVISAEITRLSGARPKAPTIEVGTTYKYQVPPFVRFASPLLQSALWTVANANLVVDHTGSIALPEEVKALELNINGAVYRMGIGGLHSSETTQAALTDDQYVIVDKDVTSYYPFIILNQGLYPLHLGPVFLTVYRNIVDRRIRAKRAGDKVIAESLKIVVNGSFGKLGNKYSILYAPNLMLQVTLTGQLALLMLIERFEMAGIRVVSANTDGIAIKCHRSMLKTMDAIVAQWELDTKFPTEEVRYMGLYSRDVNNYLALKQKEVKLLDGSTGWQEVCSGTKNKGAYSNPWSDSKNMAMRLHKNPTTTICVEAVEAYLTTGASVIDFIRNSRDITKFITVRTVRGGAVKIWGQVPPAHDTPEQLMRLAGFSEIAKDSWILPGETQREARYGHVAYKLAQELTVLPGETEYVGKTVRWYYATGVEGELVYATTGNKVPRSEGARPCMVLPEQFPQDIDYDWYIAETVKILEQIGAIPPQESK